MSLTSEDLQAIRTIVREEVRAEVAIQLAPVDTRLQGVESDVKEIYAILKLNRLKFV